MVNFTLYFFIYTLALVFWGRQIIKLVKINKNDNRQIMLEISAAMSVIIFVAYAVRFYFDNLTNYLILIFMIGLLGACLDFFQNQVRPWLKGNCKFKIIKKGLLLRDTWLAAILLACVMSVVYSAMWPTGRMENWVNNGGDFYSWIFMTEYHLGLINPNNPGFNHLFTILEMDTFGTYVMNALTSLSRGQLPYEAAAAIVVTNIVWFGTSVYYLVRQVFKFNFVLSLLISISLCLTSFINYIALTGMFGHLLFLYLFIISLTQLKDFDFQIKPLLKNLFFPLFTLFLSYQVGFILCFGIIICSIFLLSFYSLKIKLTYRFYKSLYFSLSIFVIILSLCAILMPGITIHAFERGFEAGHQQEGWSLPLINPLLFSGFPVYIIDQFIGNPPPQENSLFGYNIFIFVISIIFSIYLVKFKSFIFFNNNSTLNINSLSSNNSNISKSSSSNNKDKSFIFLLLSIYISSLLIYIIAYIHLGNLYKVWKFSAYTVLPLSFIPSSIIVLFIVKYLNKSFICKITFIFSFFILIFQFLYNNQIRDLQAKYFNFYPSYLLISSLYEANKKYPNSNLIVNFYNSSYIFFPALIFSKSNHKLTYLQSTFYIMSVHYFFDKLSYSDILISDVDFKKNNLIINSTISPDKIGFNSPIIYDYDTIQELGIVAIKSNNFIFPWVITNYPVHFQFIVPSRLVGKENIFSIILSQNQDLNPDCSQIEFGLVQEDQQIKWTNQNILNPNFFIPAEFSKNGQLDVYAKLSFVKNQRCHVNIDKVDLNLANDTVAANETNAVVTSTIATGNANTAAGDNNIKIQ
jgi:hypothetical protein